MNKATASASAQRKNARGRRRAKIHPVVIYPFRQPREHADLDALYGLVRRLDGERETYARPITVMDRKTFAAMEGDKDFLDFRKRKVAKYSDILDAWCVDTCQMWYTGLGKAFDEGGPE